GSVPRWTEYTTRAGSAPSRSTTKSVRFDCGSSRLISGVATCTGPLFVVVALPRTILASRQSHGHALHLYTQDWNHIRCCHCSCESGSPIQIGRKYAVSARAASTNRPMPISATLRERSCHPEEVARASHSPAIYPIAKIRNGV